jgi:hypothetical protein
MDSDIKKEMLALQERKVYFSEDTDITSRYQMYNQLNNNKVDFYVFDNWLKRCYLQHIMRVENRRINEKRLCSSN